MDYEQKYKETLDWMRSVYPTMTGANKEDAEHFFPELKESEDEESKKWILEYLHDGLRKSDEQFKDHFKTAIAWLEKKGEQKSVKVPKFKVGDFIQFNGMGHTRYTIKDVCGLSYYINTCNKRMDMSYTDANFELVEQKPEERESCEHWSDEQTRIKLLSFVNTWGKAKLSLTGYNRFVNYLEKQGKQKSTAWSEEDNKIIEEIINDIECARAINYHAPKEGYEFRKNWLNSLKDRVQPRQEWSEEDEYCRHQLMAFCKNCMVQDAGAKRCAHWLKSLRPQNHWKPSDEQMNTLEYYMHTLVCNEHKEILFGLYSDLKKLKG